MATETSSDVSRINDEDVLRRMWQDTEDFGRKKEIRAHMYKLREARLRDFYSSGEVNTDIQQSSTRTTTESKSCATHADSLADHSFISMKTKEIRDSESPIRDVSYRIADKGLSNQGWNIVTANEQSDDGKTFTTSKLATTSGTEKITGGQIDYAAKNEQKASVYQDGDENNFTKAVGASSNTFIKQEASGGDENSSFKTSSTKTSSSSKYVQEHRSTTGDVIESPAKITRQNQDNEMLVSRKVYTDNIPADLKKHPNYVEGKTKVTRETKTLPDGTTVTTTKYEIRGGNTTQSATSSQYSTTQQRSSTVNSSQSVESRIKQSDISSNVYSEPLQETTTVVKRIYDVNDRELQPVTTTDRTTSSTTRITSNQQLVDTVDDTGKTVKTTVVRKIYDTREEPRVVDDSKVIRSTVVENISDKKSNVTADSDTTVRASVVKSVYDTSKQVVDDSKSATTVKTTAVHTIHDTKDQIVPTSDTKTITIKTTVAKQVDDSKDIKQTQDISSTKVCRRQDNETFINTEQDDTVIRMVPSTRKPEDTKQSPVSPEKHTKPIERYEIPERQQPEDTKQRPVSPEKHSKPNERYETPERRQPIKPGKSELDTKTKPTDGQYETTYRTDYTNKRISVDVSPTHEAFARSLRAVTPDRISKCSSPSRGSLRNSTSSLRSNTSPEKMRHPSRVSPDRRSVSPKKTTSNETTTHRTKVDSVTKKHNTTEVDRRQQVTEIDSSTLTRRKNKPRSRSPSPTTTASEIEFIRNINVVTDLDTNETTIITQSRPSDLDLTKKTTRRITDKSQTSPLTDLTSPKKSPITRETPRSGSLKNISPNTDGSPTRSDKTVKRTDTYEERCRQILGITNEDSKRKNSLERITVTRKGITPKINGVDIPRKSPEKKIQEYPSQIRKLPDKEPISRSPERRSPTKTVTRSPEKEVPKKPKTPSDKISEFPSQRRSPEKQSPSRHPSKSPEKDITNRAEYKSKVVQEEAKTVSKSPSPRRPSPEKQQPRSSEPDQRNKPSNKEPLHKHPDRKEPGISEFPSQIRKSPERRRPDKTCEPSEKYPDQDLHTKDVKPQISEFPSQIRRSPEKERPNESPERKYPSQEIETTTTITENEYLRRGSDNEFSTVTEQRTTLNEFPSQVRRSPEKEPRLEYPDKNKPIPETTKPSTINEFPSQIRRSPEKEEPREYPDKNQVSREPVKSSGINEFPSQIRRSPEKEPQYEYADKDRSSPTKEIPRKNQSPSISEFPSQIRKSPEKREPREYPDKNQVPREPVKPSGINEFPSQIRRSPEKEPQIEFPDKDRSSPRKEISRKDQSPSISEFPSQIRKSPEKEPREYPVKNQVKEPSKPCGISEFPSQTRIPSRKEPQIYDYKAPKEDQPDEKKPSRQYPDDKNVTKEPQKPSRIDEFPSQIRKSPEKQPQKQYLDEKNVTPKGKDSPTVCEFPSQIRKSPEKEIQYSDKERLILETNQTSSVKKISTQINELLEREREKEYRDRRQPSEEREEPNHDVPVPKESSITKRPTQKNKEPSKVTNNEPQNRYTKSNEIPDQVTEDIKEVNKYISQTKKIQKQDISEHVDKDTISVTQVRETKPSENIPRKRQPLDETRSSSSDDEPEDNICSKEEYWSEQKTIQTKPGRDTPDQIDKVPTHHKTPSSPEKYPEKTETQTNKKVTETVSQTTKLTDKTVTTKEGSQKKSVTQAKKTSEPEKPKPKKDTPKKEEISRYPSKEPSNKNVEPIRKPKDESPSKIKRSQEKDGKTKPRTETPEKIKPKQRTVSSSSTSTDEEKDVEDHVKVTKVTELEGKIPVDEPAFTKRFISQLCREDEIQRTNLTDKKVKNVLTEEMFGSDQNVTTHKTVKKDSAEKTYDLIENERKTTNAIPRSTSPLKKPKETEKVVTVKKTTVAKPDTRTTKLTVIDDKLKPKDMKKTTVYTTRNEHKEDKTTHMRTHKTDDTVTKKVSKITVTTDSTKKSPTKKPQPTKPQEYKVLKPTEKKPLVKHTVETEIKRTSIDQKIPKRHVVTTTITVSPKTRQSPTKTVKLPSKTPTKPTKTINNIKLQNGHPISDDESIPDSLDDSKIEITTTSKQKKTTTRTTNEQIVKKKPEKKTPVRGVSKPETGTKTSKEKKVITTKSIIINNGTTEREVIVDLQRSKSSREPTPDQICPMPVSSDDETTPRYPDQITEPDEPGRRHKPNRLSDIPLIEGEDVTEFSRIVEIDDTANVRIDRVEENDESLLSVNKKINRFLDTAEKITETKQKPVPKIDRPKFEVDEDLKSDECLLSVSEKVNKFITTAEQLTAPQDFSQRPRSPKCQYYPDEETSVSDKVTHFITTAEKVVTSQKEKVPQTKKPDVKYADKPSKRDECLNISDKISRFTTEKTTPSDSSKPVSLSKIDIKSTTTTRTSEVDETHTRRTSKETTPTRKPSNTYTSIKTEIPESKYHHRDSSPKLVDSTPRSTRRSSEEAPKSVLSPTSRLRSTESVRKAKALFENINKDQQSPKQRDILSRPSVFEGRTLKTETARKLEYEHEENERVLKSTKLLLEKTREKSKSPDKELIKRRSKSPEGDVPGYMRPLDRSLRPNSPHRESISRQSQRPNSPQRDNVNKISQVSKKYTKDDQQTDTRQTKFGVTLKKTDSGRAISSTVSSTRSHYIEITEEEIENIYELEILEELLEKIADYELRRKIRAQIRLVKKLISEGKLSVTKHDDRSLEKVVKQTTDSVQRTSTKSHTYHYDERRSSSEITKVTRRSQSPQITEPLRKSPEYSPSRSTKVFPTQLKKTTPTKPVPEDYSPEWVKQRNLKKHTETTTSVKTTSKKSRSSPTKEIKSTDVITSSYGVGPTDENGSPLFGLKALRSKNVTDTTKVQGTVIRSQYYSENGQEPVGEVSVTKYSSDPRDLGRNEETKGKGLASVTTTQKFGYKDTPSLKSLTSSTKKSETYEIDEDESETKTTKVNRRGSVKALSQKFIENAVETSKSERQSSYPKAGLILRTSSFKESASSGDSREGSAERTVTVKTSSKTVSGETFLTNRSKVTGVQDVISRMKSADVREGESIEDTEARGLLNKFIGSQVILSGIEANVKSANAKRSTKITTTITENGKPTTKTRVFQHPITEEELETVWDEQTLRLLLEQSTDYEERKRIRARLRQVMAEQEACTELVEKASQDQISTTFEGESQLLPLLQGLLEAPDNEQTADSGTESGEDQRSGLIAEVQNALDKLSASLRDDTTDITPERRTSLLQLVTKLQAGLAVSLPVQERRSSVQGRFRRRQRPNRHTVGVSSEELADARRLIQEISLHDITPNSSKSSLLQKQNSEGSVGQSSSSFKPFSQQKSVVKNAVAKPFSSSNSTVSGNSSSVHTPTDQSESLDLLFHEDSVEKKPDFSYRSVSLDDQSIRRSSSGDVSFKSVQQAVQQAAAIKVLTQSQENLLESEETDEDTTVKAQMTSPERKTTDHYQMLPTNNPPDVIMQSNPIYNQHGNSAEEKSVNNPIYHQQKQSNPIYNQHANTAEEKNVNPMYHQQKPSNSIYNQHANIPEESVNPIYQKPVESNDKINRSSNRKLKMKRANTIDIPKPLNFHEEDYDSDCSLPEEDYNQRRRSNYLALRGPIRVGNPGGNRNTVPVFEPKTDNDKKFLAFINKHNENVASKSSLWSKPEPSKANIWNNKFGNIKTTFEKASTAPVQSHNSARQFWKTADNAVAEGTKYDVGRTSQQNARNLRQIFEEKQKQTQKLPWNESHDKNVVTGSLKVKAFEPNEKPTKFVPSPLPVNKFSHAPQSAFKPIPKKAPPPDIAKNVVKSEIKEKDLDSPLYLYSPKPPQNESSLKPWATSSGESRVLSLAASKFENVPQQETALIKPRKLSKDKITLPFQQQQVPEKLTAPYLVKRVDHKNERNNMVRQLSGQYDNRGEKNSDAYATYTTVKYTAPPNTDKIPHYNQQYTHQYKQQPQYPQSQYTATSQQYNPHNQHYDYQNEHYQTPRSHYTSYQGQSHYPPQSQPSYDSRSQQYPISNEKYSSQHRQTPLNTQYYSQNQYNQQYEPQHQSYTSQSYTPTNSSRPVSVQEYSNYPNQSQQYNEQQYTSNYYYQPRMQTESPISPKCNIQIDKPEEDDSHDEQPTPTQEMNESKPSKLESQVSVESLKEYNAVSSRVMTGPVCQQATTVRQKSPMNRDGHDMAAALNLRNSLQKATQKSEASQKQATVKNESRKEVSSINKDSSIREEARKSSGSTNYGYTNKQDSTQSNYPSHNYPTQDEFRNMASPPTAYKSRDYQKPNVSDNTSYDNKYNKEPQTFTSNVNYKFKEEPQRIVSPNSFSYRPREEYPKPISPHSFSYRDRGVHNSTSNYRYKSDNRPVESLEINDNGESIVTSKFQIPVINIPQSPSPQPPNQAQISSKADSWNQICLQNQQPLHKPSPRASPNARTISKSKSSHTLALPKQFEAGMSKDEMAQKRKTMEAFLSGNKSPQSLSRTSSNENLTNKSDSKVVKRSINRLKTSEKVALCRQSSSLSRSRTLPDIVCPDLLDESNVDKAFEDLFKSCS